VGGGGGVPVPPGPPAADIHLVGDDAIFSGGLLTSWTSRSAAHQIFAPFNTPLSPSSGGPLANAHQGVLFPTAGARIDTASAIKSGTSSEFAWLCVCDSDNSIGAGTREYLHYVWNGSTSSQNHWVWANQDNSNPPTVPPWASVAVYLGPNGVTEWEIPSPGVIPPPRLHLRGYRLVGTSLEFWVNGVLVGTNTVVVPPPTAFGISAIGASYQIAGQEALNAEWYKGTIYEIKGWVDTLPDDAEWAAEQLALMTAYGVATPTWLPTDVASCRAVYDARSKYRPPGASNFTGSECAKWENWAAYGTSWLAQGTVSAYPSDPGVAARINGRPVLRTDGVDDFMSQQGALSTLISNTGYECRAIIRLRNVVATGTVPYSLPCVIADTSGFWWCAIRDAGANFEAYCGHWDGAAKSAIVTVPKDTWGCLHWWFDGTNIRGQWNNGAIATTAAGNVTNVSNGVRTTRSSNNLYTNMDMAELEMFNASLSTLDRNANASYLGAKYALSL